MIMTETRRIDRTRIDVEQVLTLVRDSGLVGHGGGGFPTATKIDSARGQRPDLIVNACDGEPLVHKRHGDSFEATPLEEILAGLGVGRVVVTGAQTDACVRSTLHGAFVRGYDTTLVGDAHTTEDLTAYGAPPPESVIAHTNLYWSFQTAPGRTAGTVPTEQVSFE